MLDKRDIATHAAPGLTRQDLIEFEHQLKDEIHAFLPFKSYSLFFPQSLPAEMIERGQDPSGQLVRSRAVHLPAERTVMLPLALNGEFLGVFVARGVRLNAPKTMAAMLVRLVSLCLEKLLLYKLSTTDQLTGLANRGHFLAALEQELAVVRACVHPGASPCQDVELPAYRACLGVVYVQLDSLPQLRRDYGFAFADSALAGLAHALRDATPRQALAARFGEDVLAVLLPEGTHGRCLALAREIMDALAAVTTTHAITELEVRVALSIGVAAYPQDMDGVHYERPAGEQTQLLLHKAGRAAHTARQRGPGHILGFHQILDQGGRVQELLPMGRLTLDLGSAVEAREGQRFLVWSPDVLALPQPPAPGQTDSALYKGEIILMEARPDSSLAEVMHLGDPSRPIAPGDCLTLIRENAATVTNGHANGQAHTDAVSGLLLYRDFLAHFTRAREGSSVFSLALVRLQPKAAADGKTDPVPADSLAAQAADIARGLLDDKVVGGRYSLNSLIYYNPGLDCDGALSLYGGLAATLEERLGIEAAVGLACHPWLNFRKADCLENCRKALDYALLLKPPRIGLVNSLALTIAADRLFSQDDLFEAVEEYKQALLADEENTLARNSLGVCLARLGRLDQAKQHFAGVVRRQKNDIMAHYNLGYICQKLGETAEARTAYRRCLKLDPSHLYSLIRLGQLAERQGNLTLARKYYYQAKAAPGGEGMTHRHLARLNAAQNRMDEAREHVQRALAHDPMDAFSLSLQAKIYLEGGEDPAIAEALARQSVALRPDQKPFWLQLARALDVQDKKMESLDALAKAASL